MISLAYLVASIGIPYSDQVSRSTPGYGIIGAVITYLKRRISYFFVLFRVNYKKIGI